MTINVDDSFPETDFYQITDSGPSSIKSSDLFSKKKILLVGVPGAFTPTCSEEHLPGYVKLMDSFKKKGIDKIFFVAPNDPFVVKSWSEPYKASGIEFISDGNGDFRNKSGFEIDLSAAGLGKRFTRFAMLIENGRIKQIFNENSPGLDVSKAENVLSKI